VTNSPAARRRRHQQNQGKALVGKSTLNRLELGAAQSDGKYRKITAAVLPDYQSDRNHPEAKDVMCSVTGN
jgi:hypothetical protein